MPPAAKKAKTETTDVEYVWIYELGTNEVGISRAEFIKSLKEKKEPSPNLKRYHLFHPYLQEHIDSCYTSDKTTCRLYVFGRNWTINFAEMTRSGEDCPTTKIRRLKKTMLKRTNVVGVSGVNYVPERYVNLPTDDLCAVCRYKPTIPTRVEACGHEFCYVCVRGAYFVGHRCPTCRGPIACSPFIKPTRIDMDMHMQCPPGFISEVPASNEPGEGKKATLPLKEEFSTAEKFYWIYKAHWHGWYRYDPVTEDAIETAYKQEKSEVNLFLIGRKMTIDLKKKTQTSHYENIGYQRVPRIRKIQRIKASQLNKYKVRGIAGVDGFVRPIK